MADYRRLTEWEQALFRRLLELPFPGRGEIETQLKSALVRPIDQDGSLEIQPQQLDKAPVLKRIPVEAESKDTDGTTIHFLLHVVDGVAKELEIFKDDGSPIRTIPDPDQLEVLLLPPSKWVPKFGN